MSGHLVNAALGILHYLKHFCTIKRALRSEKDLERGPLEESRGDWFDVSIDVCYLRRSRAQKVYRNSVGADPFHGLRAVRTPRVPFTLVAFWLENASVQACER